MIAHFPSPRNAVTLVMLHLCLHVIGGGAPRPVCVEDQRVSMACTYSIRACGPSAAMIDPAINAAFSEIDRIDRLMSNYRKDSPLSLINRKAAAGPVVADPELFEFLALCKRYSRVSHGAFDVTVGPLMKTWGFFGGEGRMPTKAQVIEASSRVGWEKVILDPGGRTVRFSVEGMELDLGGIAKGYAVDRAASILKAHGISSALISAGGSTTLGFGRPWKMTVDDPLHSGQAAMSLTLRNQCLSISGTREKFFISDGRKYSHIMDPRTGEPVIGALSVAVVTDTGTNGDALDNVFFVLGLEESRKLIRKMPGTQAFFFYEAGTEGWKMTSIGGPGRRKAND